LRYYHVLRLVLKAQPHLRRCLSKCRHCQIFFLTHPRNSGRRDLGCPFGCRQAHRRQNAVKRSSEYYQSAEGKIKKRYLNTRRSECELKPSQTQSSIDGCETGVDPSVILHIRMVTSLIEGRAVGLKEILRMIEGILRQHSIDKAEKVSYGVCEPP
jgi:hypothetical protein